MHFIHDLKYNIEIHKENHFLNLNFNKSIFKLWTTTKKFKVF